MSKLYSKDGLALSVRDGEFTVYKDRGLDVNGKEVKGTPTYHGNLFHALTKLATIVASEESTTIKEYINIYSAKVNELKELLT